MPIPGLVIDTGSDIPLFRQIADQIRRAVEDQRLPPGFRLPPTRQLALDLGVNRNTVVAAFDLLIQEGLISSHTGRGSFVNPPLAFPPVSPETGAGDSWFTAFSRGVEGSGVGNLLAAYRLATAGDGISFAGSYPAGDLMPVDPFRRALASALRRRGAEVLSYGPLAGFGSLRAAIAAGMRRFGAAAGAEEILITSGSQQALELAFRALVDPGDPVILEDPTYTGALSALNSLGARLVGVPADEEGIRPDLLARALDRHRPRALYLQPAFHNPTTRVMPEARRREVLALAVRAGCAIIEDDWAADLRLEGHELPPLYVMDGGRHVIYISTFSKKLMPGLRIGWAAAPRPVVDRLVALKQIEDLGTSPLLQAGLDQFLRDGGLEDHLRRVRRAYRERRDALHEALVRAMPPGTHWHPPQGGLFFWIRLPAGLDSSELAGAARRRGVLFSPGEVFQAESGGRDCLRLTFAALAPEAIARGIGILGELVRERLPGPARPGPPGAAEALPIL